MAKKLLSFRAYAKHRGISHVSVIQAVKDGRISTIGKARKIDPAIADKEWEANSKINYRTTEPNPDKPPEEKKPEIDKFALMYNRSRALKEVYTAKLEQAKYEELVGKLVSAEKVKNQAFKTGRIIRDKILNIPDRVSHELAAESDPMKITIILTRALNEALEELSNSGTPKQE